MGRQVAGVSVRVRTPAIPLLIILLSVPSCLQHRPAGCRRLIATFFEHPVNEELDLLRTYPLDQQYEVFLCGQTMHPRANYLAAPIAKRGEEALPFLRSKLEAANDDRSIRAIIKLLEEMQREGAYNVAADEQLITLMKDAIERMENPEAQKFARGMLSGIRVDPLMPPRR